MQARLDSDKHKITAFDVIKALATTFSSTSIFHIFRFSAQRYIANLFIVGVPSGGMYLDLKKPNLFFDLPQSTQANDIGASVPNQPKMK